MTSRKRSASRAAAAWAANPAHMEQSHTESDPLHDIAQLLEVVHINPTHSRAAEERIATALERIPDYSLTLADVLKGQKSAGSGIERLEQSAFIQLSAAELTKHLIDASASIRAEDRQALQQYRDAMARSIGQVDGIVQRGQAADVQLRWLIWTGVGGLLLGIFFWSILAGAIARSLPEAWHVPEWMAARTMGMDQREAGAKLIATAPEKRAANPDVAPMRKVDRIFGEWGILPSPAAAGRSNAPASLQV